MIRLRRGSSLKTPTPLPENDIAAFVFLFFLMIFQRQVFKSISKFMKLSRAKSVDWLYTYNLSIDLARESFENLEITV